MFKKIFIDHPKSVGESYVEHLFHASRFSFKMFYGGFACLVHALVPCLCKTTGSKEIIQLHDKMVTNRAQQTPSKEGTEGDTSQRAV